MKWLSVVTRAQANDEPVRRGHWAPIDFLPVPLWDVEQQIEKTAMPPRFRNGVQILQGFRGIGLFTTLPLLCEWGDFRRFVHPTARMAYLGLLPTQRSSGPTLRYGSITQTGHVHARKALDSGAWKYTHYPRVSVALQPCRRMARPGP